MKTEKIIKYIALVSAAMHLAIFTLFDGVTRVMMGVREKIIIYNFQKREPNGS